MARKRRTTRRKSRRVGAASLNPKNPLIMLAAVAGGYLMADTINDAIDKVIPTKDVAATATVPAHKAPVVDGTVTGGIETGLGALLLWKGKNSLVKTLAGGVLAGAGIAKLLKETGVVSGYASVPVIGRRMNGYASVPVIGKIPSALNGYTTSRTAAMGVIPNALNGYTTSRMPVMGGFDEGGYRD